MDSATNVKRKKNPKENANFLSKILFIFALNTIKNGVRNEYQENDIYEIMQDYKSEKLGKHMTTLWNIEQKKLNPSIMRCLARMFGIEYALLGLALFTYEGVSLVIQPILTGKLVSYFEPNTSVTKEEAAMYAAGILACKLSFSLLDNTYFLMLQEICLKVKICLAALVYRKCLKLNLHKSPQFASGMAITLITKDIMQFDTPLDFGHMFLNGILQATIMTTLMYRRIGISALVGTSVLFILLPTQVFLGFKTSGYRMKTSSYTDQRVRITHEILTAIKIIKMYTWEQFFSKSVNNMRKKELENLRILFFIKTLAVSIGRFSSKMAFYLCVMTYVSLGYHITPENAFFITGSFSGIYILFNVSMPLGIGQLAEIKASFKRLKLFLLLEEVPLSNGNSNTENSNPEISINNVTIQTSEHVNILKNINLELHTGLTIITGSTGSGKSAVLKLIIGEIQSVEGTIKVSGDISYASQEPWLFPGSIKQNIIFGEEFNEERYKKVVEVCALKEDFDHFPNGDQTSLSDKGLNLSRGQKIRINLCRAVYKKVDIYLLDDCLSSLDSIVSNDIFNKCFKSFLNNKICILVSNQMQFFNKADNLIILGKETVEFGGTYLDFKRWNNNVNFLSNFKENLSCVSKDEVKEQTISDHTENDFSKLNITTNIYGEKKEDGSVNKRVFYQYFKQGGGVKMVILLLVASILSQVVSSCADYFVSYWVDMEQDLSGFILNQTTYTVQYKNFKQLHKEVMIQYSFVMIGAIVFTLLTALAFFIFASKASINIHTCLLHRVINVGMVFFDKNLSGNVLNRFSRDLGIIDEQMPFVIFKLTTNLLTLLGALFVVSSINLYFIVPSVFIIIALIVGQKLYLPTGRSIRRLQGSTRSPIIGHLNATLEGLPTIRASKLQELLQDEFDKHQNLYNSATYMYMSTLRGFAFYLEMISLLYISVITFTFLFIRTDATAGEVGLAITQSFSVVYMIQSTVLNWAELEIQMTATERVIEYMKIRPENRSGSKLLNWPKSGKIVFSNVSLQYSPSSQLVLKNLSLIIEPYQKIGIIGRTGAGKSSIISSLFKLYDFKGHIVIDDMNINNIETSFLRTKISIIPQDPVLFSGTVRTNLDPYCEFTDEVLWNALAKVKIKDLVKQLDNKISEGGSCFSIGQRQLLCLARALIRNNTILVLDEATANVDSSTDELLQSTIKTTFTNCTTIIITHKLTTILHCDKVLVMNLGKAVEFENPMILLNNKKGILYEMAVEAGIVL